VRTAAELVDEVLTAMAAYDAASLAPLLEDDAVWWSPKSAARFGVERPVIGRDAVVRLFTGGLGIYQARHNHVGGPPRHRGCHTRRGRVHSSSLLASGAPYMRTSTASSFDMSMDAWRKDGSTPTLPTPSPSSISDAGKLRIDARGVFLRVSR
jgi:hypothetical protein